MKDLQNQNQNQNQQLDNKPKRNPYCSRCRNHGKSAQVKGHKRHCEYRECQCEGCKLVECRQIVSAAQIKRRRYQKQDEECGRQIEISPPVLRREPSNDSAALIAQTLIGSTSGGHLRHQQYQPQQQQHQLNHHHQQQPQQQQLNHHQQPQLLPSNHQSINSINSISLLGGPAWGGSTISLQPPATTSSPLPSLHEQASMVEEIHQSYGQLAVYAWLKAEHFDLQKVHHLIELSRNAFDEILQIIGHSPLDLTSPIVDWCTRDYC